jgi:hypothetical protein
MMIAMQYIAYLLDTWVIACPMKNKAMHDVFKKSPEENATGKKKNNTYKRITIIMRCIVRQKNDYR